MIALAPIVASAQNTRSAVSVTGSDAATCTVPDPCRTFSTALSKTNLGGEVVALSSGGYGAFSVTQAVNIFSPAGIYAGIAVPAPTTVNGVGINVSTPSGQSVVLRGLYINNATGSVSGVGIFVSSSGTIVYVEDMVISKCGEGIDVGADANVRITDTVARDGGDGFFMTNATVRARAVVDGCRFENNTFGIIVAARNDVTVTNSLVAGNSIGVSIQAPTPANSRMTIKDCVIAQNGTGIDAAFADATAVFRVARSFITQNTQHAFRTQSGGGSVTSAGNNVVIDNAADETFSGTFALK